jgi:hypothetical protein
MIVNSKKSIYRNYTTKESVKIENTVTNRQ